MSSVAIQGNAAGAGVFTLASPNSASSYTLTLPTATGTIALTSNITPSVQIQPISASAAASALTISASALTLDFRSTTLGSGTVTTVSGTPANLVVPSSTLLATASAQQSRLIVVALNNAGTIELAVANITGGTNFDETTLATTTTITQGSTFTGSIAATTGVLTLSATGTGTFALGQSLSGTSVPSGTYVVSLASGTLGAAASTYLTNLSQNSAVTSTTITGSAGTGLYSTTARTSLAYRVIGYIESTQATAGTWATAPSTIQGYGGQALNAMSSLGYSQTWTNLTSSRAVGVTYYNTTGKPIQVVIGINLVAGNRSNFIVNNLELEIIQANGNNGNGAHFVIVPPGASYFTTAASTSLYSWYELR
jgi:hypothetical protein